VAARWPQPAFELAGVHRFDPPKHQFRAIEGPTAGTVHANGLVADGEQ
jgi:hypothetical protein